MLLDVSVFFKFGAVDLIPISCAPKFGEVAKDVCIGSDYSTKIPVSQRFRIFELETGQLQ